MHSRTTLQFGGPSDLLDLYSETGVDGPRPLVVWVHGGGWTSGSRTVGRAVAEAVDGTGWSVLVMDYPLIAQGKPTKVEDQVTAIWNAIQFVHERREDLGVDTGRILLSGFSAGAHLSALTYLRPDLCAGRAEAEGSGLAIRRYFGLDGAGYDVPFTMTLSLFIPNLRLVFGTNRARWAMLSPVDRLAAMGGRFPPSDVATGTSPFSLDARRFIASLRGRDVPVREVRTDLSHDIYLRGLVEEGPLRTAFLAALDAIG